jgi:hypothetical protein
MPGLRELQLEFTATLFNTLSDRGASSDRLNRWVRNDGIAVAERIDIYRNNLREGFVKALATGFPVIERLGGTDYFRQLALAFLQAHPSRAGNLHYIGEPFAPFLRERFGGSQYEYFADVAALEWAHQCALVAPDMPAITADAFSDMAAADYEHLVFEFQPACGFVDASCAVVRVWRANQPETLSDEVIDVSSTADKVLVLRTPECVEFHSLPAARFALFRALGRGERLGIALEHAQAAEPEFDLGDALRQLLDLNVLVGLRVSAPLHTRTAE